MLKRLIDDLMKRLSRKDNQRSNRACSNALARLKSPENADLVWLFSTLPKRAERGDWAASPVLQMLEANNRAFEETCLGLIRDFRGLLVQPEQASSCTKKILKPRDKNFDAKLRDFFAEVMAVVDLGRRGYARFELVTPVRGFPTPDFKAEKDGNPALIEVKNMRVPDSINEAAFAHWNAKRAELPNSFNFDVQLGIEGMAMNFRLNRLTNCLRR
jgi:hypothetical protein